MASKAVYETVCVVTAYLALVACILSCAVGEWARGGMLFLGFFLICQFPYTEAP